MSYVLSVLFILSLSFSVIGRAEDASSDSDFSPIGGSIGASYGIATFQNLDMNLPSRTMTALSVEGLVGYRPTRSWTLGADFDYRWMNQLTSLGSAGGTNLRGSGWMAGLGARYRPTERWALQAAIYFVGKLGFSQPAFSGEETGVSGPLGVRLKGQYFVFRDLPLSTDLDLSYVHHRTFRIARTDGPAGSTTLAAALGLTWHFGTLAKNEAVPSPTPSPESTPKAAEELADVAKVTQTERGTVLNLEGDVSFATNRSELSPKAKETVDKVAAVLVAHPGQRIRIEGHTDSKGTPEKNLILSQARAESVRVALVNAGVNPNLITAQGFGLTKPIGDNATPEGRAANRRVEIILDKNSQENSGEAK